MEPEQATSSFAVTEESELHIEQPQEVVRPARLSRRLRLLLLFVSTKILVLVAGYLYVLHLNSAPENFNPQIVTIEPGQSAAEIAANLATAGVVRSSELLQGALLYFQDPTKIKAATYVFDEPHTTTEVAAILVTGEFDTDLRSLTFIEGFSVREYALVAATLPNITAESFLEQAQGLEGSLFPETYFVPETITTEELITLLHNTHQERLVPYREQITANDLSAEEALILASIIEREANTPESMQIVAGIFLNRLAIGMPLQADASIEYVIDTPLGELPPGQLASELRELDSPYNTYLYPGLPPTPIGNPGEEAIRAIANPTQSDYFYYITGDDGVFYYAETYDQHLTNIARHLR